MGTRSSIILATTPSAWIRLGESSGTVAADASGNGNAFAYHGPVTLGVAAPIVGDADTGISTTLFGGGYVDGTVTGLDGGAATYSVWVKTTNTTNGVYLVSGPGAGMVFQADGTVYAQFSSNFNIASAVTTVAINDGAWHRVTMICSSTSGSISIRIMVDGVSRAAATASGSNGGFPAGTTVMLSHPFNTPPAAWDELLVWPVALSQATDANLYNADLGNVAFTAGTASVDSTTSTSATVSWTAPTNASGSVTTQLQKSAHSAATWTDVAGATISPEVSTGLVPSTQYDYRVKYIDSAAPGSPVYSGIVVATTAAPSGPALSVAKPGGSLIDGGTDAIGNVNQSTLRTRAYLLTNSGDVALTSIAVAPLPPGLSDVSSPALPATLAVGASATLTLSIDTATPGNKSLAVSIASNDAATPFDWTITARVISATPIAQDPPVVTTSPKTNTAIAVMWTRSDDTDTSDIVRRQVGGSGPFDPLVTLPGRENIYIDYDCAPATVYAYTVETLNPVGLSGQSTPASATTGAADGIISTIHANEVSVTTTPFSATLTITDNTVIAITGATNTNPVIVQAPNHRLKVGATAYGYINGVLGNTSANIYNGVFTVTDANHITLVGVAGNGAYTSGGTLFISGHYLERKEVGNGNPLHRTSLRQPPGAAVPGGVITLTDGPLKPDTTYEYKFRSENQVYSDFSAPIVVTTDARPANVPLEATNLTAVGTGTTTVDLAWTDNSGGVATFKVQRAPTPAATGEGIYWGEYAPNWVTIATTAAGATAYTDTTVVAASSYLYRVIAHGTGGDAAPTDFVPARTTRTAPSAMTYQIGPGKAYTTLAALNSSILNPGDTVTIFPNVQGGVNTPYYERYMIPVRGTPDHPIIIQGYDDPVYGLPIIDGTNATSPAWATVYDFYESVSLIFVGTHGTNDPCGPGFVTIKDLILRNAKAPNTFTGWAGDSHTWGAFATAIYVKQGDNVTIDNVTSDDNALGVFTTDKGDYVIYSERLTIRDCTFLDSGNSGSPYEHAVYIEALDCIVEGNRFGPTVGGGNQLKDRGAGTIVRYNKFESPSTHSIDMVEPETFGPIGNRLARVNRGIVYGNVFELGSTAITGGGSISYDATGIIHLGGDHGSILNRKGIIYFYNNTLVQRSNLAKQVLFATYDPIGSANIGGTMGFDARNNVILTIPDSGGIPEFDLTKVAGAGYLGPNWISAEWARANSDQIISAGGFNGHIEGEENIVNNPDNDPEFVDLAGKNYTPATGSALVGTAAAPAGSMSAFPVDRQYLSPAGTVARSNASDIGAFAFDPASSVTPLAAPAVSAITSITSTGAHVTWGNATGGTAPYGYGVQFGFDDEGETLWDNAYSGVQAINAYTLTGLVPSTLYHVRIVALDAGDVADVGAQTTFTTAAASSSSSSAPSSSSASSSTSTSSSSTGSSSSSSAGSSMLLRLTVFPCGNLVTADVVTIEDPSGTRGIWDDDTGISYAAPGQALVQGAPGKYSYSVTGVPSGQTAAWYAKVIYQGKTFYFLRRTKDGITFPVSGLFTWAEFVKRWGLINITVASNKDNTNKIPDYDAVQDAFCYADEEVNSSQKGGRYAVPLDFSQSHNVVPRRVRNWAMTIAFEYLYNSRGMDDKNKVGNKMSRQLSDVYTDMAFTHSGIREIPAALATASDGTVVTGEIVPIKGLLKGLHRWYMIGETPIPSGACYYD